MYMYSGSAFCWVDIGLPEDGFPLGLGLVMEDRPTELSCTCIVFFRRC